MKASTLWVYPNITFDLYLAIPWVLTKMNADLLLINDGLPSKLWYDTFKTSFTDREIEYKVPMVHHFCVILNLANSLVTRLFYVKEQVISILLAWLAFVYD